LQYNAFRCSYASSSVFSSSAVATPVLCDHRVNVALRGQLPEPPGMRVPLVKLIEYAADAIRIGLADQRG
jgi:hypothetical protein